MMAKAADPKAAEKTMENTVKAMETLPFILNKQGFIDYYKHNKWVVNRGSTYARIIIEAILCTFLSYQFIMNTPSKFHYLGILIILIFILDIFYLSIIAPVRSWQQFEKQPYLKLPRIYRITKSGIRTTLGIKGLDKEWEKTKISEWDNFNGVFKVNDTILIYIRNGGAVIVQRSGFSTVEDFNAFFQSANSFYLQSFTPSPHVNT